MFGRVALACLLIACGGDDGGDGPDASAVRDAALQDAAPGDAALDAPEDDGEPYPAPDGWGPNAGPGGPNRAFEEAELYRNCATLDGGELDELDHHNLVTMLDGYLLMPWAPEAFAGGGLTFFDVSDPCAPRVVGTGFSIEMRETHSVGFFEDDGRRFAAVDQMRGVYEGGVEFWDVTEPTAPEAVSSALVPGFQYPDAYARVTLSVFWQGPWVYVAATDNGLYIVDARDPLAPRVAAQYSFDPTLRAGQVQVIGNLLVLSAAEGSRVALLDVSVPDAPQPMPGGGGFVVTVDGVPQDSYFSNLVGGFHYHARKSGGGGLVVYDIRDPTAPVFAGSVLSEGDGGYCFVKDELAFTGESNYAAVYDVSDLGAIREVTRLQLQGDLDTATPIGNVVFLSVDDEAAPDAGTAVAPFQREIDSRAPRVTWAYPADGATDLAPTSRFGIGLSEFVDVRSAWQGSVRLYETEPGPADGRVDGWVSAQETLVNFTPREPLRPGVRYTLEVPAGGLADFNGNAIEEPYRATFTVAGP